MPAQLSGTIDRKENWSDAQARSWHAIGKRCQWVWFGSEDDIPFRTGTAEPPSEDRFARDAEECNREHWEMPIWDRLNPVKDSALAYRACMARKWDEKLAPVPSEAPGPPE